jgi:hypothetical protein
MESRETNPAAVPQQVELRKELLENMLYLMRCGHIMPVLEYVLGWPKTVDQGLLRHFVAQVRSPALLVALPSLTPHVSIGRVGVEHD